MIPYLDSHALQVIQRVHKSLQIASIPQLVACRIVFEQSPIDVVVRRVSIHESIQEQSVQREPPISRRRSIGFSFPFPRVLEWVRRLSICVQIPVKLPRVVGCRDDCNSQVAKETDEAAQHVGET
jgi:hypothetical protein